ncbi:MAG TPA: hypothetical protein VNX28_10540 [Gemmataceae bacterium]|nr:hypothetical protein [Gemmataceae bacterium]
MNVAGLGEAGHIADLPDKEECATDVRLTRLPGPHFGLELGQMCGDGLAGLGGDGFLSHVDDTVTPKRHTGDLGSQEALGRLLVERLGAILTPLTGSVVPFGNPEPRAAALEK